MACSITLTGEKVLREKRTRISISGSSNSTVFSKVVSIPPSFIFIETSSPVSRDSNPQVVSINGEISKSIGTFNPSVKVHNILNRTRNLTHTVTANYEEDPYRMMMDRYILFGVKWNFGKMNAVHSARAQQAAWKMLF